MLPLLPSHPEIRIIPGIETSAEGELYCHLLGYFVELDRPGFQERLADFRRLRLERIAAMVKKINALGIPIEYERVVALAAGGSVGRPHLADALIEKNVVKTRQQAFDRYLKRDGPVYVAGESPTAADVIRVYSLRERDSRSGAPFLLHHSRTLKAVVGYGSHGD